MADERVVPSSRDERSNDDVVKRDGHEAELEYLLQQLETLRFAPWDLDVNQERGGGSFASRKNVSPTEWSSLPSSCLLESFSDDVSALILSHLDLQEIANVSLVSKSFFKSCRSNTLWKYLMTYRWNMSPPAEGDMDDYFSAYRQAHAHPHDLWISHWNCVFPYESLAPGRCFVSENSQNKGSRLDKKKHSKRKGYTNSPWSSCPNCRNWNEFETATSEDDLALHHPCTPAQLMALATSSTRRKCPNPPDRLGGGGNDNDDGWSESSSFKARQAFGCAGTFHRTLKVDQYRAGPCNFVTDLLFFNLTDPATDQGQWELGQLLREAQEQQNEPEDGRTRVGDLRSPNNNTTDPALFETSHHSWHICRLYNPDFYRPILYQIGVQRPDCFTVYPSEGYIEPGGTKYLTIGVRPLGSALAYAFDALNVQRDELHVGWADLYTEQAHLPMAPILVRYQFAAAPPSKADPVHDPRRRPPPFYSSSSSGSATDDHAAVLQRQQHGTTTNQELKKQAMLDYHWRQPVAAHQIRSIHLSAHVHSHYVFQDFLKATCHPWNVKRDCGGPLFVAPVLHELYPAVYQKLQDVAEDSNLRLQIIASHTEGPCVDCGQSWGVREEELAQAYMLCQVETADHMERRAVLLNNIMQCVRLIYGGLSGEPAKLSTLLAAVSHALQCLIASPWTSVQQQRIVLQLEAIVDDAYRQIPVGGENWVPWRLAGTYRYAVCTDSVFQGPLLEDETIDADFKDEPDYLDAFRHLAHSPGRYCLGPQEDPNHLGETVVPSSPRYYRLQKGMATDVFMDDHISALQAGICMMRDARSLLVHGIYDRIPYPGSVVRRPKLYSLRSSSLSQRRRFSAIIAKPLLQALKMRCTFTFLQNGLDLDSSFAVEGNPDAKEEVDYNPSNPGSLSLRNYLRGVPPPGVGRYPLSRELPATANGISNAPTRIVALELENEGESPSGIGQESTETQNNTNHQVRPNRPQGGNMRGPPRLLHLLWILGAQLGLAVIDSPGVVSVFVDRTILIASQWVSISLMAAPLFWTLCARYAQLIPAQPVDYNLEGLPFPISNKMRFLTDRECGYVAVLVLFVWLALGRWVERHVHRDFFRVMLEHITPNSDRGQKMVRMRRFAARLSLWFQRAWDACCPLFLQRRVFAPQWNRRTRDDLMKHMAFWRSRNLDRPSVARPAVRRGEFVFGDMRDAGVNVGSVSSTTKLVVGVLVALGSFTSSSPHFWLNLVTVFSCSISLGMSVSLHSMEKGRPNVNLRSTGSMIKAASLATTVIFSFLVGQLVGSSGGTMFLAEFIVTSISLVLGGAGTISASAMESWGCFFCLSTTAFWGYLFGRVALMDGIRQKRGGYSSILLSKAVIFLFFFWVLIFMVSTWDAPVSLVIVRPVLPKESPVLDGRLARKLLQ